MHKMFAWSAIHYHSTIKVIICAKEKYLGYQDFKCEIANEISYHNCQVKLNYVLSTVLVVNERYVKNKTFLLWCYGILHWLNDVTNFVLKLICFLWKLSMSVLYPKKMLLSEVISFSLRSIFLGHPVWLYLLYLIYDH